MICLYILPSGGHTLAASIYSRHVSRGLARKQAANEVSTLLKGEMLNKERLYGRKKKHYNKRGTLVSVAFMLWWNHAMS